MALDLGCLFTFRAVLVFVLFVLPSFTIKLADWWQAWYTNLIFWLSVLAWVGMIVWCVGQIF